MSSEPKNIMTMAELLRAAKLKREQEEREQNLSEEVTIPPATIAPASIPHKTIPRDTIPRSTTPRPSMVRSSKARAIKNSSSIPLGTIPVDTIPPDTIPSNIIVDASKGFFPYLNDLSDRVIPGLKLKPLEQVVLNRLYRLSHGWKSEECTVGLGTLAKQCVMSRTSVQKSIGILVEKGLIEDLGEDKKGGKEGKRYRVLPGMAIPSRTIPRDTIVNDDDTIVSNTTEPRDTIPSDTTNKDSNKDLINTHSNTGGVRVGSKFTLEECRKYAQHLQSTGQGINNPGGYATTIHRTGEADVLIKNFLHPDTTASSSNLDTSGCPDCRGTGFYYPQGADGGVIRCKHERLQKGVN